MAIRYALPTAVKDDLMVIMGIQSALACTCPCAFALSPLQVSGSGSGELLPQWGVCLLSLTIWERG